MLPAEGFEAAGRQLELALQAAALGAQVLRLLPGLWRLSRYRTLAVMQASRCWPPQPAVLQAS